MIKTPITETEKGLMRERLRNMNMPDPDATESLEILREQVWAHVRCAMNAVTDVIKAEQALGNLVCALVPVLRACAEGDQGKVMAAAVEFADKHVSIVSSSDKPAVTH